MRERQRERERERERESDSDTWLAKMTNIIGSCLTNSLQIQEY